ncbi:MAG: ribbon-helix-helix protein, CopG family [Aquificae bacterium]|nr:ribbon-helix-helix protein, CopG family [Aquificota bacterium]
MALKTGKVRKNITISREAERKLKELAEKEKKSQSAVIEELINQVYKKTEKKKKLEALKRIKERRKYFEGIDPDITIQKIKEQMGSEL